MIFTSTWSQYNAPLAVSPTFSAYVDIRSITIFTCIRHCGHVESWACWRNGIINFWLGSTGYHWYIGLNKGIFEYSNWLFYWLEFSYWFYFIHYPFFDHAFIWSSFGFVGKRLLYSFATSLIILNNISIWNIF